MNVDHFEFILPSEITEKKKIKIRKQIGYAKCSSLMYYYSLRVNNVMYDNVWHF